MPLATVPFSSLMTGAPRVTRHAGHVRVEQTRAVGWALLALGAGVPAAILHSKYGGPPPALPQRLAHAFAAADGMARLGLGLAALLFGGAAAYGLFWLLWQRVFDIDLNLGRWRFTTRLAGWTKTGAGRVDDAFVAQLFCKRMAASRMHGDGTLSPGGGPLRESWELRLVIPGQREPLFLGEWGLRDEALTEIAAWRAILPRLTVEKTGDTS